MSAFLEKSRALIVSLTLFLFPLLFLPITTEFYATNKQYLLVISASILLLLSLLGVVGSKKVRRETKIFDIPLLMLLGATALSTLLTSVNKPAAIVTPVTGIVTIAALAVLYYVLSRETHEDSLSSYASILQYAVTVVCIIEIAVYILPFLNLDLAQSAAFFASPLFSPLGSIIDLVAFLGFFFVYTGVRLYLAISNRETSAADVASFFLVTAALALATITYIRTPSINLPYAPFNYSLKTIPQLLKNPLNAAFGYGVDNFSVLFTQAKDPAYATSVTGPIQSFSYSRSALIQLIGETGIAGLFAILIVFLKGFYESQALPRDVKIAAFSLFFYLLAAFIAFPPSIVLLFLLFITLGLLHHDIIAHSHRHAEKPFVKKMKVPQVLSSMLAVLAFCAVSAGLYQMVLYYRADLSYRHSADSIGSRSLSQTYSDQYNAITLNPYQEKYHISFSQTNLYIANQIAINTKKSGSKLSPSDQSTVTNAIKTAIEESRAAALLNPQKAANWENRGRIYKNLLNVAEKADIFAIGAYERAGLLDPYNPVYKNDLGEVYYLTGEYKQAATRFEEAIKLKPDYTNAAYNLAWSYYQLGKKPQAIAQMEKLLDTHESQKIRADLERFKK